MAGKKGAPGRFEIMLAQPTNIARGVEFNQRRDTRFRRGGGRESRSAAPQAADRNKTRPMPDEGGPGGPARGVGRWGAPEHLFRVVYRLSRGGRLRLDEVSLLRCAEATGVPRAGGRAVNRPGLLLHDGLYDDSAAFRGHDRAGDRG